MPEAVPAVRFSGITKSFPGITALSNVSFDVAAGTCHAVCGENGAGKSTLGKILAGITEPDAGAIELDGAPVRFASPRDALAAGVAMVHQELAFCDNLTVGDNLCLGDLPRRGGVFVDEHAVQRRASERLAVLGVDIAPWRAMTSLSVAEQQLVQIAAAVGEGARVIVFDEPTSSLGDAEAERLYALIGALKARGVTVLYVSHRMNEIFRLSDSITVLRDGAHVMTQRAASTNERAVVSAMIGREVSQYFPGHAAKPRGREMLRVEHLTPGSHGAHPVSFAIHAGEVVGLAGLVGAGRSEIANAIFGLDPACKGRVHVRGQPVAIRTPRDAVRQGIGYVPEDRKKQGLVLSMSPRENATLPTLNRVAHGGWLDPYGEDAFIADAFERLHVRATSDAATGTLSGGNQQKIVLSKWLAAGSEILILDEPTRGVDVGTKAELHAWIDQRASEGAAILLISSELPELLNVSTRILVLRAGRVVGEVARDSATQEGLLKMMAGLQA